MTRPALLVFPFVLVSVLFAQSDSAIDPLPAPITNNAVASVSSIGSLTLYSFMGLGAKKTWSSVTNVGLALDAKTGAWTSTRPVPGTAGRLGAIALTMRDHIFLIGGYVLDSQGGENTVPDVNVYEPASDRWFRGQDVPVPVSATVGGVYRDRYIYLISGWSKTSAVQNVQMYDAQKSVWSQATPIPGPAVFGHAGAIVDDTIIYIDGAQKNPGGSPAYAASDECWMGKIDHKDPAKITWTKLPPHPGDARFRIAAGGSGKDDRVYFTGGSSRPYVTSGMGFDGQPAEPSPVTFAYNLKTNKWDVIDDKVENPTMDQRGLIVTSQYLVLIGGMSKDRAIVADVRLLPKKPGAPKPETSKPEAPKPEEPKQEDPPKQ